MGRKKDDVSNKAIKYRIYPTEEQAEFFNKTFGCCRKIWNLMLHDIKENYATSGKTIYPQPAQYKEKYPFLKEVDSLALCNKRLDIIRAFNRFFGNVKKGKKKGFPKYKKKGKCKCSYTTNNQVKKSSSTIKIIDNKYIRLPKIGKIKAIIHRIPNANWRLKSATVEMKKDGTYYISILFEYDKEDIIIPKSDNAIGLDYKSDGLYMDSNGNIGTNHKFYREAQFKLRKEQRVLSRKKGSKKNETKSNNYLKQQKKVNKLYTHITNQRFDNLHKLSTEIANQYDIVCVESLNIQAMANKGFGNGKATYDNGYGTFLNLLQYKLEDRGKYLIKVDKWYPSSQLCCNCGTRHSEMKIIKGKMPKTMNCSCGNAINRDLNAAVNIKNEGLRILFES